MLETRSANLMELAAALPRDIGAADHRYQYIERQLKNREIDADTFRRTVRSSGAENSSRPANRSSCRARARPG